MNKNIECPHCWCSFKISDVLFVSSHEQLIGDLVTGSEEQTRFLPSRFNEFGSAIDPFGLETSEIACPRCGLSLPRLLLDLSAFPVSIVGSPGSGKSYLLAASISELRHIMPTLGFTFEDVDPNINKNIIKSEKKLFQASDLEKIVSLKKTEINGTEFYNNSDLAGQSKTFLSPMQFVFGNIRDKKNDRILVLYDCAGEHFMPGNNHVSVPSMSCLVKSKAIIFLLDLLQDPSFNKLFESSSSLKQNDVRQSMILNEIILRVRKGLGLRHNEYCNKPLIIALSKVDVWGDTFQLNDLSSVPIRCENKRIDFKKITETSLKIRNQLNKFIPDFVNLAEAFSQSVYFVPNSAIGRDLQFEKSENEYGIRPKDIKPRWAPVPLLLSMFLDNDKMLGNKVILDEI